MKNQHLYRFCLGAVRQQAITWANVDPDICRNMASLWQNLCMVPKTNQPISMPYMTSLGPMSQKYIYIYIPLNDISYTCQTSKACLSLVSFIPSDIGKLGETKSPQVATFMISQSMPATLKRKLNCKNPDYHYRVDLYDMKKIMRLL